MVSHSLLFLAACLVAYSQANEQGESEDSTCGDHNSLLQAVQSIEEVQSTASCCMMVKTKVHGLDWYKKKHWEEKTGKCKLGYQEKGGPFKKTKCASQKARDDCRATHHGCWQPVKSGGVCYEDAFAFQDHPYYKMQKDKDRPNPLNSESDGRVPFDCSSFFAGLKKRGRDITSEAYDKYNKKESPEPDRGEPDRGEPDRGEPDRGPSDDDGCMGPITPGKTRCYVAGKECFYACKQMMRAFERGLTTQHTVFSGYSVVKEAEPYCGWGYTRGINDGAIENVYFWNKNYGPEVWRGKWSQEFLCEDGVSNCQVMDVPDCSKVSCSNTKCKLHQTACRESCEAKCMEQKQSQIDDETC